MFCGHLGMDAEGNANIFGGHEVNKMTSIYDWKKGAWERGKDMNFSRWYPTATFTGDDSFVIVAGVRGGTNTAELGSPDRGYVELGSNLWTMANRPAVFPSNFLAPDGSICVAGPTRIWKFDHKAASPKITEIAVPPTGLAHATGGAGTATVLYRKGKILVIGGRTNRCFSIDVNEPRLWLAKSPA